MKRVDERDTMFARANYQKGSQAYEDYYMKNPHKKSIDDSIRSRPNLCEEGTMTYNELNSAIPEASFQFLGDIIHLCEGKINPEKIICSKKVITKRIKGLAKKYGANLVGITKLQDYHFYTHRGRHEENYGEKINCNHKYAIVFACEMDKDMINRGPMISEVIETSKCYVDTAIVGMILSYYIRNLGYDARNHMDSNYLLIPGLVAKDAGLGEIGRNTILTTKEYGSRVRLGVVSTDLELEIDEPITFGLEDFCRLCKNCAFTCPSQSLSNETEKFSNDKVNWIVNQETCYIKWRYLGTDCGMCIASCPFSQEMESIKKVDTFKGNEQLIGEVLSEFRKKYGKRPFVPGNPDWLR
ncbi:reductive dehalogenase domain-containing protein [Tepidibacter hydrothermalis]|uniref:Reductive dehalogenase domain-containing protein n=1 Tax=Tepidibacter hydrothermalis TaxID=3036126 RepID=A0ABY8EDX2_9FIRM|nr:reductive dehalogenase domain-containing protein [Tepidibacter hydrothermalis]WFD11136.1 reductive dehalogenase domain-containing protein [Tepidibacter hydrothermalis]